MQQLMLARIKMSPKPLFKEAIRLVRSMVKDASRGELLSKVAVDLAHADMPEAEKVFNEAVREIRSVQEDVEKMRALAALSLAFYSKNAKLSALLFEFSLDEVEVIRDPRIQASAIRQLAGFEAWKGRGDKKRQLTERAQKIEEDFDENVVLDDDYMTSQDLIRLRSQVLFKGGQIKEALKGIGHAHINPTIELLARLSPEIDALEDGLSINVLKEAMACSRVDSSRMG